MVVGELQVAPSLCRPWEFPHIKQCVINEFRVLKGNHYTPETAMESIALVAADNAEVAEIKGAHCKRLADEMLTLAS